VALKGKFLIAILLLVILATVSLLCGAAALGSENWLKLLTFSGLDPAVKTILWQIRVPRILGAALAGILLAVAGCTVQLLFRNPLSSPHVLGAVNSSALGSVLVMALCGGGAAAVLGGSIAGALLSLLLLLFLGRSCRQIVSLLLAGIALNAFASAAMSGVLFAAGERLEGVIFWLLGGFWKLDWLRCNILLVATLVILPLLLLVRREMNMLYLGAAAAAAAGVNTKKVIFIAVLASSLATALVVGNCGVIGFVGLLIPHIARRIFGGEFRNQLLGSSVCGACLMIAADTASRTLMIPLEIPVGVLTALIGAPFFFVLIFCRIKRYEGLAV